MRIEFQFPVFAPPLGGVERYILAAGAAFQDLGHDCQVLAGPARRSGAQAAPFPVYRHGDLRPSGLGLLIRPWLEARRLPGAMAAVERPTPDLVIARFPSYAVAARATLPATTPVVYLAAEELVARQRREAQGSGVRRRLAARAFLPQWAALERRAQDAADWVVTFSENLRRQLSRHGAVAVAVLPPGVDTERFAPDPSARGEVRRELGVGPEEPMVLSVGRLSPEKNLGVALEALALLEAPPVYVLAGEGDLRAPLEARAAALGVAERVRFLGNVDRPERLYAAADLLLHPARAEAFGHVLLEAMAAGLPVAAADPAGGRYPVASAEILPEGHRHLFDPEHPEEVARVLAKLLGDPGLRAAAGAAGRDHVRSRFSWEVHARGLLELVVGTGEPPP